MLIRLRHTATIPSAKRRNAKNKRRRVLPKRAFVRTTSFERLIGSGSTTLLVFDLYRLPDSGLVVDTAGAYMHVSSHSLGNESASDIKARRIMRNDSLRLLTAIARHFLKSHSLLRTHLVGV